MYVLLAPHASYTVLKTTPFPPVFWFRCTFGLNDCPKMGEVNNPVAYFILVNGRESGMYFMDIITPTLAPAAKKTLSLIHI